MSTILERYLEVDQEIKALEKLKKELRAEIGDLQLGSTVVNEDYRIIASETRRFDPSLAQDILDPDTYQRILKTVPDVKLAQRVVAPEFLDLMYKTTSQTWTIKERDDK